MASTSGSDAAREGLFASLKNFMATLLAMGKTRAELLVVEIEEEQHRFLSLLAKAAGAAFLFAFGLIMVVLCLAHAFWEQRVFIFGACAALFLGLGAVLAVLLRRQVNRPGRLFRGSLAELAHDIEELKRTIHAKPHE